ncbi:MAG: tetratricopeptide repeat protein [Phycisphaerae bacterium]|jgi:predicted O-linked N-acetylglucosamine transferase (SPINDLY family)
MIGKSREKIKSCHHKVDIRKSSTFQETAPKKDNMQIGISSDTPKFLVEANAAITTGQIERARELVNDQGVEKVRRIIQENPSRTDIMLMLAVMLHRTRQLDKAEEWFKRILAVEPNALVYNELAVICDAKGCFSEGAEFLKKAIELAPDVLALKVNLAKKLRTIGRVQEGIELLREAVEKEPDNSIFHSNLLLELHYLSEIDCQSLFEEHKRWGQIHAPANKARTIHNNNPDPDRRLRIGYISPDFYGHAIASFFEPLLDGRNREAVEVYGYGNVERPDNVTERLKEKFDHYRNIRGTEDEKAAKLIEADKIDILVDLAGHTGGNRLLALAYKPAPVQVTYLGCADTTGMKQVDYRLTDKWADSPDSQKFYTEELIYLPEGFLCYKPAYHTSVVSELPANKKGYVTFGSFNNNCKINPFIIGLWAKILKNNDNSRLLLKFKAGGDQEARECYYHQFEQLGIPRDRLEIHGWKRRVEYLELYRSMDIALDTYPYNGHTTTCEAMWMGVPTISLVGKHFASRVGLSILSCAGLEFFAASCPDEYVTKATALAKNCQALAKIRAAMRQRMAGSILGDAKRFSGSVEQAYRQMWHRWCQSHGANVPLIKAECKK